MTPEERTGFGVAKVTLSAVRSAVTKRFNLLAGGCCPAWGARTIGPIVAGAVKPVLATNRRNTGARAGARYVMLMMRSDKP
jgi:hypothetical protein